MAKEKRTIGTIPGLIIIVAATWAIFKFYGVDFDSGTQAQPAASKPAAQVEPVRATWQRQSGSDPMTDREIVVLSLRSTNSVAFDFPYNMRGGSHLTLSFRQRGGRLDAYLRIDKGQMLCNSMDCGFSLRIGNGSVQKWTGLESSTHDSDIMFVRDARQLESIIKRGEPIRVGMEFFQAGTKAFYFDTEDYPGFK